MQKIISILTISLFIFGCGNEPPKEKSPTNSNQQPSKVDDQSKIGRTNYAVVWKWATDDTKLVEDNIVNISHELTKLWKEDLVENTYFDTDTKIDKLDYFGNVTFFLKAQNEAEAKSILDQLTVVTKRIATYTLHPVGLLWLDRKTELINKKGMTKSFVSVWTTTKSPLHGNNADDVLKSQSDAILALWNKGTIENVYFDIEGTYEPNKKTDFVFFVNVNSEEEAKSICESLPFFQHKMATYELHQVGVFWMGKYEEN